MEEDEGIHDMWAALLANASLDQGRVVRPSFISILQEMAPDEALYLRNFPSFEDFAESLDAAARRKLRIPKPESGDPTPHLPDRLRYEAYTQLITRFPSETEELFTMRLRTCGSILVKLGLLFNEEHLTPAGRLFLSACSKPQTEGGKVG